MDDFIFVVDDDVSQDELQHAIQESFTNDSIFVKASSVNRMSNTMDRVKRPAVEVKNAVWKQIHRNKFLGPNDHWDVTPLQRPLKSHSEELKEKLKSRQEDVKVSDDSRKGCITCSMCSSPDQNNPNNSLKRKSSSTSSNSQTNNEKRQKKDFLDSMNNNSSTEEDQKILSITQTKNDTTTSVSNNEQSIFDINSINTVEESNPVRDDNYYCQLSQSIPDDAYVALDCEMVGVGDKGRKSVLGRCSIVDYKGMVIYDKYVRPSEFITDFRTRWSGIKPCHMRIAVPIDRALFEIKGLLKNKIVIGHAVYNDFDVIHIKPDHFLVRDTAQCKLLTEWAGLATRGNGLKKLAAAILKQDIQVGKKGHCSVEDARASLELFKYARSQWEPMLLRSWAEKKGIDVEERLCKREEPKGDNYLEDRFWPNHVS